VIKDVLRRELPDECRRLIGNNWRLVAECAAHFSALRIEVTVGWKSITVQDNYSTAILASDQQHARI
jgi:hypothetical protein